MCLDKTSDRPYIDSDGEFSPNNKERVMQKGTFVSVWDGGYEIRTACEFDYEKNLIENVEFSDGSNNDRVDQLDREYVEDAEGNEYEVCTECHEKFLKGQMFPSKVNDTVLEEKVVCPNCHEE